MNNEEIIKGFKVFRPDWTCSPNGNTKQYTCPGKFEEEGELDICNHGMHFCQTAADCFNYYSFNSKNKVAEIIAYGDVRTDGYELCTNKLEIVREIPWDEVLRIVNIGKNVRVSVTPGIITPGTGTLETATPETGTPGTGTLGTRTPETATPEIGTPETATPEFATLKTATLETGTLGTTTPGTGTLETATPETATPGTGTPGTGTNRLLILVVLTQKNRRLYCLISHQI